MQISLLYFSRIYVENVILITFSTLTSQDILKFFTEKERERFSNFILQHFISFRPDCTNVTLILSEAKNSFCLCLFLALKRDKEF